MDIKGIIKDSVRYPFSDWKKILMLGVFIILSSITGIVTSLGYTNNYILLPLVVVGFITGLFVNGYLIKILKTSLNEDDKPPEFQNWMNMLIDGFKLFLVSIVYLVLPILLLLFIVVLVIGFDVSFFGVTFDSLQSMGVNPLVFLVSVTLPLIENIIIITSSLLPELAFPFFFYLLLIIPIFLVAISYMGYNYGELRSAFKIKEIIEEISDIGWINLIIWYVVTGIIFLLFMLLSNIIAYLGSFLNFILISTILSLILIPYFFMFYVRALSLLYMIE